MIQQLLLTRGGFFEVAASGVEDEHRCGKRGDDRIHYHVAVVGDPSRLTPEGFVLDHNKIQRYFETAYAGAVSLPSCEHMAMQACEALAKLIGCPVRLEVTVGGTPQSGLTAFWTPEDGTALGCLYPRTGSGGTVLQLASEAILGAVS